MACLLLVFIVLPMLPYTYIYYPNDGNTAANNVENTGNSGDSGDIADGMTFDVLAAARTSGVVTPDTEFFIEVAEESFLPMIWKTASQSSLPWTLPCRQKMRRFIR